MRTVGVRGTRGLHGKLLSILSTVHDRLVGHLALQPLHLLASALYDEVAALSVGLHAREAQLAEGDPAVVGAQQPV